MSLSDLDIRVEVPEFKKRLLQCLKSEVPYIQNRRRTRAYRWAAAAAMLLLVLGLGYFRSTFHTPATDLISVKIQKTYGFGHMDNAGATASSAPEANNPDRVPLDVKKAMIKKAILKLDDIIVPDEGSVVSENTYAVAY